mmetsp:Transcript_52108/g.103509  ORF Transcript_52108/g.103509 Transcript_52108/m.103509 type:complete len:211 (-) Transcript_52108:862-1494(-)
MDRDNSCTLQNLRPHGQYDRRQDLSHRRLRRGPNSRPGFGLRVVRLGFHEGGCFQSCDEDVVDGRAGCPPRPLPPRECLHRHQTLPDRRAGRRGQPRGRSRRARDERPHVVHAFGDTGLPALRPRRFHRGGRPSPLRGGRLRRGLRRGGHRGRADSRRLGWGGVGPGVFRWRLRSTHDNRARRLRGGGARRQGVRAWGLAVDVLRAVHKG